MPILPIAMTFQLILRQPGAQGITWQAILCGMIQSHREQRQQLCGHYNVEREVGRVAALCLGGAADYGQQVAVVLRRREVLLRLHSHQSC